MDAVKVKNLREKLRAGQNFPITVNINNNTRLIDESAPGQFTLWDDDNEILYSIFITPMECDPLVNSVTVFGVHYELIEGMQLSKLPVDYLPQVLESICVSDKIATKEHQDKIVNAMNFLLSTSVKDKTRENVNRFTGANLSTKDDYYNGKLAYSKQETAPTINNHKYVDSLKEKE